MALPSDGNCLAANRSLAGNFASGPAGFPNGFNADAVTIGGTCFSLLLAWASPISMFSATTVKATSNDPDRATKRTCIMLPISDPISRLCDTNDHLNIRCGAHFAYWHLADIGRQLNGVRP